MSERRPSQFPDRGGYERDEARDSRGRQRDPYSDDYYRSRHDGPRSRSPSTRYSSHGSHYQGREEHNAGSYGNQKDYPYNQGRTQGWEQKQQQQQQPYYDSSMYDDQAGPRQYEGHARRGRRDSFNRGPEGRRGSTRSRSSSRDAGKPSDTVILENLPHGISQSELMHALQRLPVTSKLGKLDIRIQGAARRAFVQFSSVDEAVRFIRDHHPNLFLDMPNSAGEPPNREYSIFTHFARPREDEVRAPMNAGPWNCIYCGFDNYATRTKCKQCDAPMPGQNNVGDLTGATDTGTDPSFMLVLYPLPANMNEEVLAREAKRLELEKPNPVQETQAGAPKLKSTAPVGGLAQGCGARPGSLHRVFLMREKTTGRSFKYGFVEFWTLDDATQALQRVMNSRGFMIGSAMVNISRIHMGVFLPEDRAITREVERESFVPLLNPTIRARYWDDRLFPSEKVVNSESPDAILKAKPADVAAADQQKPKKRKAEGSSGASASKKAAPMAGQMALWQKKHDEIHSEPSVKGNNSVPSTANQVPVRSSTAGTSKSKPDPPIKFSLSGVTRFGASADSPSTSDQKPPEKSDVGTEAAQDRSAGSTDPKPISYVDFKKLQCYVCVMAYKSVADLTKHEKSRNHKEKSSDEERVRKAMPKVRARDALLKKEAEKEKAEKAEESEGEIKKEDIKQEETDQSAGSQYRDRAKERRQMFKQPAKQPTAPANKPSANEGGEPSTTTSASVKKPPAQSKGLSMLLKQGWTGEGLGANGEGRTEAIATNIYHERAGLGVEGGIIGDAAEVAASNTTRDRGGLSSSRVQDMMRDRYYQERKEGDKGSSG